jgi:hypothetical protein
VLLPCALLLFAAIMLLGPPLGRALFGPPGDWTFWTRTGPVLRPEPTEHARYAIALSAPPLLAGAALMLARRPMRGTVSSALVALSQAALLVFVLACVAVQQRHVYDVDYAAERQAHPMVLFTVRTLVVAVLLALLAAWALRRPRLVARARAALRESSIRRAGAIGVAALSVLSWLLSAFNTDGTIEFANASVTENIVFWSDEAFAILDGHAPLVDFHAQYGHLWAYIAAGGLALFGGSLGVYAAIMLAGTAGAMAAVLATLCRIAGSWLAALGLFLPFVATSFFMEVGPPENRYGPANLFSIFPIRYGGPYVLLWLVVRRVQRGSARPPMALFTLAGLVVINNLEFGLPAFVATLVALATTAADRSPRALARLGAAALAGVAAAVALVALLTLVVAGSLPDFRMLTTFPRIFGSEGFGLLPMPALGLHLVVYTTFVAAVVTAAILAVSADRATDAALTGALAWAGIFGLGAGSYFVGRSHPHVLIDLFSAWALALILLLIVVVRTMVRRLPRRPQLAELLVLAGFGVAVCSLAQLPTPWSQIERIERTRPVAERVDPSVLTLVDQVTRRGESVALMIPLGHRIAYQLELDNVTPYANMESMMTLEQWREMLIALRRAGGHRLLAPKFLLFPERQALLFDAGYVPVRHSPVAGGTIEFVDATLRPTN